MGYHELKPPRINSICPNPDVILRRHAAFGIDQNGMNQKSRASEAVTAGHRLTKTGGSLAPRKTWKESAQA